MKLAVLGAGGWGTALAISLAGHQVGGVRLWARRLEAAEALQRERVNAAYLPGVRLPPSVEVTHELGSALDGLSAVLVAVPSVGMTELLSALPRDLGVVLCAKGLAPGGERLSVLAGNLGFARVAVLSGPNHAEEIGRGLPAATVVASADPDFAHAVQRALMTPNLRVYTSPDVPGVELGGVLKNVVAVAAGLGDGLELGDNARASVITRGLREMARYLASQGAAPDTVYGLSGLGDLVATATSRHSRNRAAGEALARGEPTAQGEKVVEGLRTARLLAAWAQAQGSSMPIVQGVAAVASGQMTARAALSALMERSARPEDDSE